MTPAQQTPLARPAFVGMVLAIDLGGVSGFCALSINSERPTRPIWGHVNLFSDVGRGRIAANLCRWVDGLIDQVDPRLIVIEAPYLPQPAKKVRLRSGEYFGRVVEQRIPLNEKSIRTIYGMPYVIEMVADIRKVRMEEFAIGDVCRFWTGRGSWGGRDQKKAATMRMCELYGFSPVTQDESDTIAVAMYTEGLYAPRISRLRGVGPLFARGR